MKQLQTVQELMDGCVHFFEQECYSPNRIERYRFLWKNKLIPFMFQKSFLYYDPSVGENYIRYNIGDSISPIEREIIRSIKVLNEFQEKGTIRRAYRKPITRELSGEIGCLMNRYLLHLECLRRSKITISAHRLFLSRFLFYLKNNQISNIEEIREVHVSSFVSTQKNQIGVVSAIRLFFRFLFEERIIKLDLTTVIQPYKLAIRAKLPSVYTAKEVFQIESSINRDYATGKRNYAMTLLASRLGLRASDIAHLTFRNIDWENSTIKLSQFKTGKVIDLPLLADVGEAIIDYLKYGRKKSASPYIFLYSSAPFNAMTNGSISCALGLIVRSSGVDTTERRHGPHAMRHSLASRFLENQVSLPVISEALGHQSITNTMPYLRIDVESLRQCALNVPLVEPSFYEQEGGTFYE